MVRMGYRAWCARMNRKTRSGSPCSPARTRLPPLPGCRAPDAGDGSHVEGAPVPPAQRLSARQRACRHPARLASPKWKSTGRSARTRAPALRACVQIAPDRPSVAGTPADKRFGSGASDTSKINFKGVHQTGSTPTSDPYSVVGFYSQLAQARSFGSDWGQPLICIETALLLARPILAGEIFGRERLDLIRRQQTILAIDTCLREVFGVGEQTGA